MRVSILVLLLLVNGCVTYKHEPTTTREIKCKGFYGAHECQAKEEVTTESTRIDYRVWYWLGLGITIPICAIVDVADHLNRVDDGSCFYNVLISEKYR